MYKLISPVENGRWSFLKGQYIFHNVVWLSSKEDTKKYELIDENGEKIDADIDKCLEEC